VLTDQIPETIGGLFSASLDHCQATRDVVRITIAHIVVIVAVLVTAAAALVTAAVKPLNDAAECPIKALDLFVIELAPNAVPQVL
jgi:hypothetical protein